jgi:hypothetical protein
MRSQLGEAKMEIPITYVIQNHNKKGFKLFFSLYIIFLFICSLAYPGECMRGNARQRASVALQRSLLGEMRGLGRNEQGRAEHIPLGKQCAIDLGLNFKEK